jgi:type I restriction enzyme S subunit
MIGESQTDAAFAIAEAYSRLEAFVASSEEVCSGAHRLEGIFYGDAGYRAKQSMIRAGFPSVQLSEVASVFWPGSCGSYSEFHRTYVDDKKAGVLFLTTADMLQARFDSPRYVSRALTFGGLKVTPGCILISGSGTIGNTVMTTEEFSDACVSHDAFRVTPNAGGMRGLVYCFFQSQAGQFLITRNKSGGVVEHIYEHDLNTLSIPLLPRNLRVELTRLIDLSCELRVKANRLLDDAQEQLQRSCYLPDMESFMPKSVFGFEANAEIFILSSNARLSEGRGFGEVRMDATYHEPVALAIAKHIHNSKGGTTLGTLVLGVRNSSLRKRIYVDDPAQGVPLIGGKQLIQWRPMGVNYLSRVLTRNLESEKVFKGWTIVSCGGTLGRCQFIHRTFEGWVMSQDVMRIIPDTSRVFPGFLYAFLSSPYGQAQIMQRGYGSVIPRLREFQFGSIAVRLPDDRGEAIDSTVVAAFELRADARDAEDRAIGLFEEAVHRGRAYIEAEWGTEY